MTNPPKAKLFTKDDVDVAAALEDKADQEISPLALDETGDFWYPLKGAKFASCHSLTIAFPPPADEDAAGAANQYEIFYLGLKGESTGLRRSTVHAVYEARALPQDHKTKDEAGGSAASGLGEK